ncbi:MAG TPA: AtpZ/AtpI family protein [Micromonosporaceae bacterium]|jgi:F0F1-type ATP synthase assembly protein I|nr:AtpZ/AtpI family protein [Micromonosporaceae bacterium]
MAGDQRPQPPPGPDPSSGAGQGWTAISYLIAGILVWGVIGWLVDRWLHTGGVATAIGALVGAAGGIYLIYLRFGRSGDQP